MKTVKKFKTFEELKSCQDKEKSEVSTLKHHLAFEKLLAEIRIAKGGPSNKKPVDI